MSRGLLKYRITDEGLARLRGELSGRADVVYVRDYNILRSLEVPIKPYTVYEVIKKYIHRERPIGYTPNIEDIEKSLEKLAFLGYVEIGEE